MAYAIISSGVYQIKNLANGKVYIGSSVNIKARWANHRSSLRKDKHHSAALQRAWNKYGKDGFEFSILEIVDDRAMLFERENFYVTKFKSADGRNGYNTLVKAGSAAGYRHTAEAKRKMSDGQKKIPYEQRLTFCVSFAGRKHSEETKQKMRESNRHTSPTAEQRAAISKVHKGKIISDEHKAIVSKATALKNKTPEMRAKVSAALKGRVFTPEWRAKLSEAGKRRASQRRNDDAQPPHDLYGA